MLLFALATYACGQPSPTPTPKHITQHIDQDEWEDSIGLKFITVTSKTSDTVYYTQERRMTRRVASMAYDGDSIFHSDPAKAPFKDTGCFAVHFCKKHLMIYIMQRAPCVEDKLARYPQ